MRILHGAAQPVMGKVCGGCTHSKGRSAEIYGIRPEPDGSVQPLAVARGRKQLGNAVFAPRHEFCKALT